MGRTPRSASDAPVGLLELRRPYDLLHNGSRRTLMRLSPILAAAFAAVLPAFGAPCDRACLKSSLDQYLQAI